MPRVGAGPSTIRFFGHASRPGTARGQSPQNWRYRMGRIGGSSIKFVTDNEVWDVAAWACESSCFANNPTQQIGSGLGELEIKPEPLRYIVCATRELLEEFLDQRRGVVVRQVQPGVPRPNQRAIMTGDGFGKPLGILNSQAGIPICETSDATPPGMFTWQDLVMLRFQIPQNFADGGSYRDERAHARF